ncbi:hypothetical protein OY671_002651 [Metschnikowia pulcherrima]|nr:hypothetical protein OY671_002651 [Metschnikowia pulcherrima]
MSIPATHKVSLARQVSESPAGIEFAEIEAPQITGAHDVIVKNKYGGVNFLDAYFRKGLYPAKFPNVFGWEAAGTVAAVGKNVSQYKVGDKVVYIAPQAFAQYTKLSEKGVHNKKLSPSATDEDLKKWAAILTQGLTAIALSVEAHEVKKGDFVLVWAAAGGMGQSLTQYTSSIGARVIAVASTDEKLEIAKKNGAEFVVRADKDVAAKVAEITEGKGVRASFDGVGKDSFEASLASVGKNGTLVSFGSTSGPIEPFSLKKLGMLNVKITSFSLFKALETKEEWNKYTDILEKALAEKSIDVAISKTYPLSEYAQATTDLEARKSVGKLVLEIE